MPGCRIEPISIIYYEKNYEYFPVANKEADLAVVHHICYLVSAMGRASPAVATVIQGVTALYKSGLSRLEAVGSSLVSKPYTDSGTGQLKFREVTCPNYQVMFHINAIGAATLLHL